MRDIEEGTGVLRQLQRHLSWLHIRQVQHVHRWPGCVHDCMDALISQAIQQGSTLLWIIGVTLAPVRQWGVAIGLDNLGTPHLHQVDHSATNAAAAADHQSYARSVPKAHQLPLHNATA